MRIFWGILLFTWGLAYDVGERIDSIMLASQHASSHTLNMETRYVLISFDKRTTHLQNRTIARKGGSGYLEREKIFSMVDASQVPPSILSLFVLPNLQSYEAPLLLCHDANLCRQFPYLEGHLTLLQLDRGEVRALTFIDEARFLEAILP
ncbi:MAG: hypothetical protein KU37_07670 [Sulfuricurvum sp. PC08-66]|nr:MAG: hypothetical protein KU37_07670 [Sulfuricurvum sp. PC08-66]